MRISALRLHVRRSDVCACASVLNHLVVQAVSSIASRVHFVRNCLAVNVNVNTPRREVYLVMFIPTF